MTNRVQKVIIYHLARANIYAAREILKQLEKEEDKEEARRIFAAVGIEYEAKYINHSKTRNDQTD